jgi:hypothetical protein
MKLLTLAAVSLLLTACDPSSDALQSVEQERILKEGTAQTGMPRIRNFRERRLAREILEMRDQGLTTYTYLFSEMTGRLRFFCNSIGYPLPAATQYTNPQRYSTRSGVALPQAEPNGLFSASSAEASYVICISPTGKPVPIYSEPRLITSPFKLPE